MKYRLRLSYVVLQRLTEMLTTEPNRLIDCTSGMSRLPNTFEWLVGSTSERSISMKHWSPRIIVAAARSEIEFHQSLQQALRYCSPGSFTAAIVLGLGLVAGRLSAAHRAEHRLQTLDEVSIIGPGMPRVQLRPSLGLFKANSTRRSDLIRFFNSHLDPEPDSLWSRTQAALTETVWQRLTTLRIGLVGCGRTGSLLAMGLGRFGVVFLTLIDPDRIESHNLGEMDGVVSADLGRTKTDALTERLEQQRLRPGAPFKSISESIMSYSALAAIKESDVLVSCVDNAGARLATAFLAALYLKPLLDIGTGILDAVVAGEPRATSTIAVTGPPRRMGADVRLVLPDRCLLCLGGTGNDGGATGGVLRNTWQRHGRESNTDWRVQRAGSLRSLNGLAVNLGLRLLEDFMTTRISESVWLHVEFDELGIPTIEHRRPAATSDCPLCRLLGCGDVSLHDFLSLPHNA